ncbi:MAG: hypothetical protein ACLPJH_04300 [Myxococcaceae bacterium]
MARLHWVTLAVLLSGGCRRSEAPLSPEVAARVEAQVRAFAQGVAQDVTRDGPAAWEGFFQDGPAFFMADEGQLVFPNRSAATAAIAQLVTGVRHIELTWGPDIRVDPLTASLASLAASYREVRVDAAGQTVNERGYFTAVCEKRAGRWQFRNAHWSVAAH